MSPGSCIFISRAAHGMFNSNLVSTSGCRTPKRPMDLSFTIISAHLPGKYVGSEIMKNKISLLLCWYFMALHILDNFGRGQLTYPRCSWASLLGSLPVLSAHSFVVTDNCPSWISVTKLVLNLIHAVKFKNANKECILPEDQWMALPPKLYCQFQTKIMRPYKKGFRNLFLERELCYRD